MSLSRFAEAIVTVTGLATIIVGVPTGLYFAAAGLVERHEAAYARYYGTPEWQTEHVSWIAFYRRQLEADPCYRDRWGTWQVSGNQSYYIGPYNRAVNEYRTYMDRALIGSQYRTVAATLPQRLEPCALTPGFHGWWS